MNRAAKYAERLHPEPFTILGLRLQPFSLQHYFLLSRLNVAFVSENPETATISDLVLGVLVCSRKWEEGQFEEYFSGTDWEQEIQKWGETIGVFEVQEKVKLFSEYIAEGSQYPDYIDEHDGRSSSAHWSQSVLMCLTSSLNYTRQEALHCPLTQALTDYFQYAENNGAVTLITAEMAEAAEKNSKAFEAVLGKGAVCGHV